MITLYSKPDCVFCEKAKRWLIKHGIAFEAVDISISPEAKQFVLDQGHKSVPQIYFNNRILVEGGYTGLSNCEPDQLKEMIKNAVTEGL